MTPSRPSTPDRPAERVVDEVCSALGMDGDRQHAPLDGGGDRGRRDAAAHDPRPTAVFCLSDSIACGVYAAAAAQGLEIPRDLSVAGYDDHPIARVVAPPLTSVDWGLADVATAAAGLLAAAVEGKPRGRPRPGPGLAGARRARVDGAAAMSSPGERRLYDR